MNKNSGLEMETDSENDSSLETETKKRLDVAHFDLPVHEIRCGFRSAVYFWRSKRILEQDRHRAHITHQIFQKNEEVKICGTDEALAILKVATGYFKDYEKALALFDEFLALKQRLQVYPSGADPQVYLHCAKKMAELSLELDSLWVDQFREVEVYALHDGDRLMAWETAMLIEGDYALFAHLESLYLGVLARRTKIATNSHRVVQAARGKPVLFFADRFDHFYMQDGDGYAARIGGVSGVASNAMASWYGEKGIGTVPHALIVSYGGDSALVNAKFSEYFPEINNISLVDFKNDCVQTALEAARKLGEKLWGVRLDVAENVIDRSLQEETHLKDSERYGVTPRLVEKVRTALDNEGFQHVKIIVSGGFNPQRIARFEALSAPVDVYAVGSWILSGCYDFTADAVRLDGKKLAKVGREYRPNPRLEKVNY
ncbi:MAG: quinolinate phosphoribosyl transferase [bacterium]